MSVASALQQARIEIVINRRCNTDAFEIWMLRIEKKICIDWADCTRQSQHCRTPLVNPAVANFDCRSRWRRNAPIGRQLIRRQNFNQTLWPFQVKRFIFFLENERHAMDEDLERGGRLMLAYID